jgi:hypothetical protein
LFRSHFSTEQLKCFLEFDDSFQQEQLLVQILRSSISCALQADTNDLKGRFDPGGYCLFHTRSFLLCSQLVSTMCLKYFKHMRRRLYILPKTGQESSECSSALSTTGSINSLIQENNTPEYKCQYNMIFTQYPLSISKLIFLDSKAGIFFEQEWVVKKLFFAVIVLSSLLFC